MAISDQSYEEFSALVQRLKNAVDILIQHSETYYIMSDLLEERSRLPGGKAFGLLRQAVGFEIVNRIYRLTDGATDSQNFRVLKTEFLDREMIQEKMFLHFNYDHRKDIGEFREFLAGSTKLIDDIYSSFEIKKVKVFRQRYTGHLIPNPRDLDKFGRDADVNELSSADLRKLTDGLAGVLDMVLYISERSNFPFKDMATIARAEARELWRQSWAGE